MSILDFFSGSGEEPKIFSIDYSDGLDLCARQVVIASLVYYGLGDELMNDAEFDMKCKRLAKNWDKLTDFRKWQLGSKEDIAATGFHVKVTTLAANSAVIWLQEKNMAKVGVWPVIYNNKDWIFDKNVQCRWLNPSDFIWNNDARN